MPSRIFAGIVCLLLAECGRASPPPSASVPAAAAVEAAFGAGEFVASSGERVPYRLLAPAAPEPGRRYPLVLQLHGSGAIGDDNRAQLGGYARGWATAAARERFPAWVLVPQLAARTVEYAAGDGEADPVSRPLPSLAAGLELLDSLRRALPVDPERVYAVGFSMGGSAAWQALLLRPGVFAAAVVIAGVPPPRAELARLPRVPLLLLHGTADTENPYAAARGAWEALRDAGRHEVEFRSYPGLGHEVPGDVMGGDGWREWMFARRR